MKKKILVVIYNRANYARIKTVLEAIKNHKKLSLHLVLASSSVMYRFGNLDAIIKKDGFFINDKIYSMVEGGDLSTMAKSTGLAIIDLSNLFSRIKPDIVLTIADRFETLATATTASYMNITLAHTQGGEITGSIDESVRHAITKMANIHFPSTIKAKKNIIKMGEEKKNVILSGCPSIDLAKKILNEKKKKNINLIIKKYEGVGENKILYDNFLVVLQHPVTTEFEKTTKQIDETIKAIHKLKMNTVWLWPNIDAGNDLISKQIRIYREKYKPKNIRFFKNFDPEDFIRILIKAKCIIGNSSVGIRECSYIGTPSVNIGLRQNKREHGSNVINVNYDSEEIIKATIRQIRHGRYSIEKIFGNGYAGIEIAKYLSNYKIINTQKTLTY